MGAVPDQLGGDVLSDNNLGLQSILVPDDQYFAYKSIESNGLGVMRGAVYCINMPSPEITDFDENQYDSSLNIKKSDVNHETEFSFEWDEDYDGWRITAYSNTDDTSVVIPAYRSDKKPIVSIG